MDRRDFIKLTAVIGASATLASCGNPEHQLIRFVPDDDIVPGVAEWKPSVCPLCSGGCGMTVRVMDADYDVVRNGERGVVKILAAKKLEGQPGHPINRGGLCPRGQAAIQITYHPDRIRQPLKRRGARGSGDFAPVSWDEAVAELVAQLDRLAAAGDQKALTVITRARRSRRQELIAEFAKRFGAPAPIAVALFGDDVLRRANAISFGREQLPTVDLARSRFVLSFGADFLGTWNSPVAQSAGYGEMRRGNPQTRGVFVQVESRMSQTGANADEWIPVKPGTEGVLALGIAGVIAGKSDYTLDQVETITGVAAKRVERLARAFAETKPAVAIAGGPALAHTNALATALAVNELNKLAGTVGQPGGLLFVPASSKYDVRSVKAEELAAAKVVLLDEGNPVYASPKALKVREALENVPFIASFGNFVDDTSAMADLILPDHSFLESWTDSLPESGAAGAVANAAAPVMRPLHDTRATPDVIIDVAGKLKTPVALPWKSFDEMLQKSMPEEAWATVQKQGWTELKGEQSSNFSVRSSSSQPPTPSPRYEPAQFAGDPQEYPFHFLPYASQAFYDGSTAHLPWLQELPDPLTSAMWSSWIEVNPATAQKLQVAQGDLVDVTSTQGTVRVPVLLFPGIAPDMVAMPVGQGHETFTRYASKRGANPVAILAPIAEKETGALAWAATRVKVARAADADGSLIMFAGEMREHPHEHETR